jgi:uncharacterized protein (DUF433 family)
MKDLPMAPKPQALPVVLIPHPHVRVDQAILSGSPHVSGSRVPVRRIFGFYRDGTKIETIMRRFPQLGAACVLDAIAFALDNPEVIEADDAREAALLSSAGAKSAKNSRAENQMILPFDELKSAEKRRSSRNAESIKSSK